MTFFTNLLRFIIMTSLFRKIAACYFFIFVVQAPTMLLGLDVKYCYIRDTAKHEFNQKLLTTILDKELDKLDSNITFIDQANYLSARISKIANTLLKQGFSADAYGVPNFDQNSIISFYCFALWEGEKNTRGAIPLTFFVYIWPSEELALKHSPSNPLNCHYRSTIHSHPIPCAFAVLQGILIQKNYECIRSDPRSKIVRLIDEEIFREGEGDVDDLAKHCIHQLYNRNSGSKICLSLHAYGLSSAEKVMECFKETLSDCTYDLAH